MAYLASSKIKMFPSAYRDYNADPESYYTTEGNLTKAETLGFKNRSFVQEFIEHENNFISVVLEGYRFTFLKSDLDALKNASFSSASEIYANIYYTYKGDDKTFKTLVDANGNTSLDSGTNFVGITFDIVAGNSTSTIYCSSIKVYEKVSGTWKIPDASKLNISTTQVQNGDSSTKPISQELDTGTLTASNATISSSLTTNRFEACSATIGEIVGTKATYSGSIFLEDNTITTPYLEATTQITTPKLYTNEIYATSSSKNLSINANDTTSNKKFIANASEDVYGTLSIKQSGTNNTTSISNTHISTREGYFYSLSVGNNVITPNLSVDGEANFNAHATGEHNGIINYYSYSAEDKWSTFINASNYLYTQYGYCGAGSLDFALVGNYYGSCSSSTIYIFKHDDESHVVATEDYVENSGHYFTGSIGMNALKTSATPSTTTRVVGINNSNGSLFSYSLTKASPSASGNAISFIDTISQNEYGQITATKKSVREASASQSGIVSTSSQHFKGGKTFDDDVTIGSHGTGVNKQLKVYGPIFAGRYSVGASEYSHSPAIYFPKPSPSGNQSYAGIGTYASEPNLIWFSAVQPNDTTADPQWKNEVQLRWGFNGGIETTGDSRIGEWGKSSILNVVGPIYANRWSVGDQASNRDVPVITLNTGTGNNRKGIGYHGTTNEVYFGGVTGNSDSTTFEWDDSATNKWRFDGNVYADNLLDVSKTSTVWFSSYSKNTFQVYQGKTYQFVLEIPYNIGAEKKADFIGLGTNRILLSYGEYSANVYAMIGMGWDEYIYRVTIGSNGHLDNVERARLEGSLQLNWVSYDSAGGAGFDCIIHYKQLD